MPLSSTVCVTCLLYVQVELQSLMAIADVDGDGLIDYNEFVAATMHVSKLEKEELLQKVCWLCSHLASTADIASDQVHGVLHHSYQVPTVPNGCPPAQITLA